MLAISFTTNIVFAADILPPVTTSTRNPATPNGWNSWYTSPITVTLNPTDLESGVKEVNYRVNSGIWQKQEFQNTLNLAQNPSFEIGDSGSNTLLQHWEQANANPDAIYNQDTTVSYPTTPSSSAKIESTGDPANWYAIANKTQFIPTTPFDNMNAYVWVKTQNVTGSVYYKVYMVLRDGLGNISYSLIDQSATVTGTVDWTKISSMFIVSDVTAIGIYMEIGLEGPGTLWVDNAYVSSSSLQPEATVILGTDTSSGRLEYYSVDNAGNTETYSCTAPIKNCFTYKMDQTPPGDWNDSGAFRGLFGRDYELYVYTNVLDAMSGISTFTDRYQYYTELNPSFGRYSNILSCSSTWQANSSVFLISPPFIPGAHSAYLLTPKTSFCNNNWRACKIVRFFAQDLAGNTGTKDFCINGPWIRVIGEGLVRSNTEIDMLSESPSDNTDAIIESSANTIDFFTSSKNWEVKNLPDIDARTYDDYQEITKSKETVSGLQTTSGVYQINGDLTLNSGSIPPGFLSNNVKQIYFVNGSLTIDTNMDLNNSSAVMFISNSNIRIAKTVTLVEAALSADNQIQTAYDITEGESVSTLAMYGVFSADRFLFQRTLQGTNNSATPSEDFHFEPKYLVELKDYFEGGYSVVWK